jgi:hypothetical protein
MPPRRRNAQQTCDDMKARYVKRYRTQPVTLEQKAATLRREAPLANGTWKVKCRNALRRESETVLAANAREEGWKIPAYAVLWWAEYHDGLERAGQDPDSRRARDTWNRMSKDERAEYKPEPDVPQPDSTDSRPVSIPRYFLEPPAESDTDVYSPYEGSDTE